MKTLKSYLETLDENEMIYLGTKNGSSFIVIEPVHTIIEKMDQINDIVHDRIVSGLNNAQRVLDTYPNLIIELQNKIDSEQDHKKRKELKAKLEMAEAKFATAFGSRKRYRGAVSWKKKFGDRIVKDVYEHETDIPGTTIIVEGFDNGTLWFKDEHKVL